MKKQYSHSLAGLQVRFPYENPYAQQKVMMCRLITALKQRKNCLIESPTGTGKSLSLLCGALSFVEEQKRLQCEAQAHTTTTPSPRKPDCDTSAAASTTPGSGDQSLRTPTKMTPHCEEPWKPKSVLDMYDELEEDAERQTVKLHSVSGRKSLLNDTSSAESQMDVKVPKIFYGTRTHRQVSQIVSEFNRTDYRAMKMTILASRTRMCVNPKVIGPRRHGGGPTPSVNDECRSLMKLARKGLGCIFYLKLQKASRASMYPTKLNCGNGEPWDIEDLRQIGLDHAYCPYYWAVQLAETADIVFCPYNYILDPTIRKAMDINLEGNIVILDEAHNIEDICRDSIGLELSFSNLVYTENFIRSLTRSSNESYAMSQILPIIGSLRCALHSEGMDATLTEPRQFDSQQLCSFLEIAHLGLATWSQTKCILDKLLTEGSDNEEPTVDKDGSEHSAPELDARCKSVFAAIANTLSHFYKDNMKYANCFRAAVKKQIVETSTEELDGKPEIFFNIYCLDPAVGLVDIKDNLHSLIVASGTLSPMRSFQCELNVPFPISLSLNHVVSPSQMVACVLTRGPARTELKCDYKNMAGLALQDDLGQALVRINTKIPNGVLCFFPSYSAMNRMCERWRMTGVWQELERTKRVFVEGQSNLPEMMREYYQASLTQHGALLMAVCRGRVSEGEDFPDGFARAVLIIGLPFPNFKDVVIKDKMQFNDRRARRGDDVMTGQDWYGAQAFRALNQALGRCIRHSSDWGAIVLLESRVATNPRYKEMLSRWVRERTMDVAKFEALENRLAEFVQERQMEREMANGGSEGKAAGPTDREAAKLRGGTGLVNRFGEGEDDVGLDSSSTGNRTPSKRRRKMYAMFQPLPKRRLGKPATAGPSSGNYSLLGHATTSVAKVEASQQISTTSVVDGSVQPIIIEDSSPERKPALTLTAPPTQIPVSIQLPKQATTQDVNIVILDTTADDDNDDSSDIFSE